MTTAAITFDPLSRGLGNHRRPARIGYVAIALTFGGLGAWAGLAPLDSATVAAGQVAIESDRKPIQHLEGGIVREILARETEHVEEGQVLFRLEPVQAMANLETFRQQLDDGRAQEARLVAEREDATELVFPADLVGREARPETAALVADQRRQFAEHRQFVANDAKLQEARIDQANQDIASRQSQAALLQQQLDGYNTEYDGLAGLVKKGFYPRNKLNVLDRERLRIAGDLKGVQADIGRLRGASNEGHLQILQIRQHDVDQASQELVTVRARIAELRERLTIATDIMVRHEVRAPRTGVVQDIKVHAVGAVVHPGETIAELVTVADRLIMTAKVLATDIQNVQAGQRTEVRFPTLAHQQRRPAYGRLDSISADLITDDATHQSFYAARVVLDPDTLDAPVAQRLVPGMPADLLILNGERTTLQYIFEPVMTRIAKTLREK